MASAIDICNLALAHLGDEANVASIDPPEASPQAAHCSRFYPIARDELLEWHAWNFSTKRKLLAELSVTPPDAWEFAYAMPAGCIKPLRVLSPGQVADPTLIFSDAEPNGRQIVGDNDAQNYIVEAQDDGTITLYTNVEEATLVYTARITDTAKFSPLFVASLAYLLASYLAGPITRDPKVKQGMLQLAMSMAGRAATSDANARRSNAYNDFKPGSISART